ncbi:putative quinol monooxygenase [Pseudozobellia sp. WGM2]|uniref:putative quinol monooxygenase n=1 Tax=Pseudozobellia sp. WGM2 TaxID=2787625 RepID=UPI001FD7C4A6|nr:antibiotic biosynthesis monooxygenase [Pseudozobellia sp. WGM2]
MIDLGLHRVWLTAIYSMIFAMTFAQEKGPYGDENLLENMMVRIAEVEVEADYLDEYISILKEEAAASVRLEPGVICIYPMFEKENPAQIRLLEIYVDKAAYESHLLTPHFRHYKKSTLPMVKSLRLVDMEAIDKKTMATIFKKINMQ